MVYRSAFLFLFVLMTIGLSACYKPSDQETDDNDASTGTDGDSDGDSDGDADGDTDACPNGEYEGDYYLEGGDSLEGLFGYTSMTGSLELEEYWLGNFEGLEGLSKIGGDLIIPYSYVLLNLRGLDGLREVGGDLKIGYGGVQEENPINSLAGLDNLERVGGDLIILGCPNIESFQNLGRLKHIGGELQLNGLNATDLCGFEQVEFIGEDVYIHLDEIVDLRCFPNISRINGALHLIRNSSLENLDGLKNITEIEEDLMVRWNENLTSIDGLQNLVKVSGEVIISGSSALNNLDGLSGIQSIGTDLTIFQNKIVDLNGLGKLTAIGGELHLEANNELTDMSGLSGLTSIGGNIIFCGNRLITNLDDLKNLTYIGGSLQIPGSRLERINLENLGEIGKSIWVSENHVLTEIAFKNLKTFNGRLDISYNITLPNCKAKAIEQQLIEAGWSGESKIVGNLD
ncbi:MAG: hypothetical protein GY839_20530, partial [candidate division Zixibacteria bacterium]|nr:hypothetical protein [candidate division Zixibacteria bacterium]